MYGTVPWAFGKCGVPSTEVESTMRGVAVSKRHGGGSGGNGAITANR